MSYDLALSVLQEAMNHGVREFCVCPGARNAPLTQLLETQEDIVQYYWFEERSAAFFALGRSKLTQRPVAVITTSGTAAAELLPATMDAYYTGIPLLLITADRPKRFRYAGAPQSCEQVGLFGHYVQFCQDLEAGASCCLEDWMQDRPVHVNVCFEEPKPSLSNAAKVKFDSKKRNPVVYGTPFNPHCHELDRFLNKVERPLVIVSTLKEQFRAGVIEFLLKLQAPVYLESYSGIRENAELQKLRITASDKIMDRAARAGYAIDGILRIGDVPTNRLWRDLEEMQDKIEVCSISDLHFSGLSWSRSVHVPLDVFFKKYNLTKSYNTSLYKKWLEDDATYQINLKQLFAEEPYAEPSLFHQLSLKLPEQANIFLGTSLPVREWDQAAVAVDRKFKVSASRGINGIDGRISIFLGMAQPSKSNWALIGDLTALYDMAAPWILQQMPEIKVNIVVVNNGGGMLFKPMFTSPAFLNSHDLSFKPLADMWGLHYERWTQVPDMRESPESRLIELVPDNAATERFHRALLNPALSDPL